MARTMSIRMEEKDIAFLRRLSEEQKGDLSKAVRELVDRGRLMLAVERYREGKASLGQAAELAGVPLAEMIDVLADFGIPANLEREDYLAGLENLRRAW